MQRVITVELVIALFILLTTFVVIRKMENRDKKQEENKGEGEPSQDNLDKLQKILVAAFIVVLIIGIIFVVLDNSRDVGIVSWNSSTSTTDNTQSTQLTTTTIMTTTSRVTTTTNISNSVCVLNGTYSCSTTTTTFVDDPRCKIVKVQDGYYSATCTISNRTVERYGNSLADIRHKISLLNGTAI